MQEWYKNWDNLLQLSNWLIDNNRLVHHAKLKDNQKEVIDFFEKPWKWENEFNEMIEERNPVLEP